MRSTLAATRVGARSSCVQKAGYLVSDEVTVPLVEHWQTVGFEN